MTEALPRARATLLTDHHPGPRSFRTALLVAAAVHLLAVLAVPPIALRAYRPSYEESIPVLPPIPDPITIPDPPAEVAAPLRGETVLVDGEPDLPLLPWDEVVPMPTVPVVSDVFPVEEFYDEAPVLVHAVEPRYPDLARQAGAEGTVQVQVSVDVTGRVVEARVVDTDTVASLGRAALEAARGFLFRPATQRGRPVAAKVVIPFVFRLD
jgi:protein TonB